MRGAGGRPLNEAELRAVRELREKQDALAAELREELPKIRERVDKNLEPVKEAVKPVGGPKKPIITEQYKVGRRYGDVMWELDEALQNRGAKDGERNVRVGDLGFKKKARSKQELKDARWRKLKTGVILGIITILLIAMVAAAITTALR